MPGRGAERPNGNLTATGFSAATEDDKLCQAIGDSPRIAVPPRDLLWFRDHCGCYPTLGCAAHGTPRMKELNEEAAAAVTRLKKQAEEKKAREKKARAPKIKREAEVAALLKKEAGPARESGDGEWLWRLRLRNALDETCIGALHRLKGRGPNDLIGDTKDDWNRLVEAEVERRLAEQEKGPSSPPAASTRDARTATE